MRTAAIFIGLMVSVVIPANAGVMQDLPKHIQACAKEGKINQDIIKRIASMKEFLTPDVGCALECIAKEFGVINSQGKYELDILVNDIVDSHQFDDPTASQLSSFVAQCVEKAEQGKNSAKECTVSQKIAECLKVLFHPH